MEYLPTGNMHHNQQHF